MKLAADDERQRGAGAAGGAGLSAVVGGGAGGGHDQLNGSCPAQGAGRDRGLQGRGLAAGTAAVAAQAGVGQLAASSLKAALDRTGTIPRRGMWPWLRCWACWTGWKPSPPATRVTKPVAVVAVLCQVRDQDVNCPARRRSCAAGRTKDGRISVEDAQMRHGRSPARSCLTATSGTC